jgi:hypothetical protein
MSEKAVSDDLEALILKFFLKRFVIVYTSIDCNRFDRIFIAYIDIIAT